MEDLLNNFADQHIESPIEIPYIYHFVDDSPVGSEYDRPVRQVPATPAAPDNKDPFLHMEPPVSRQATFSGKEDEGDYKADIDDDDDDVYEPRHRKALQVDNYPEISASEATHNGRSLLVGDTDELDRSFPEHKGGTLTANRVDSGKESGDVESLPPAVSDGEQEMDDINQHLRKFHRQDLERDQLLEKLHQENLKLKSVLKKSVPDSNSRARAAERNLFEIRKSLDNSPYVCVLVDGKGYKIHENLLQLGKQGGHEAADHLHDEVTDYLQQYNDAKDWKIMVHFYVDVGGLLAHCVSNDVPLDESCVRNFMLGFTQARPLCAIVDVGQDEGILSQKVEAMFHLFAKNTQCKHLIFGCCHNAAYVAVLEKYGCNPITASNITLLKSYEISPHFEGLPFSFVEFPRVFRSTPYKGTDRLPEGVGYMQDLPQQSDLNHTTKEPQKTSGIDRAQRNESIAKWQATADASWPVLAPTRAAPREWPVLAPARPAPKATPGWTMEKKVLLNINDERVDSELGEIDHVTSESMLERMETQHFCAFHHLQNHCVAESLGKPCGFRHGPRLNGDELRFLMRVSRGRLCNSGSTCHRDYCIYGHVCPNDPGCEKGSRCLFSRFHGVDKTAVKVWSPEKSLSPRKKGSRA